MQADDPQTGDPQTGGADSPRARPPGDGAGRAGEGEERVGPLLLRRCLKDDGRALLLYRHADEQADGT